MTAEEIDRQEEEIIVYTKFTEFGHMQKFLESRQLEAKSSELQYIPNTTKELSEEEQDEVGDAGQQEGHQQNRNWGFHKRTRLG